MTRTSKGVKILKEQLPEGTQAAKGSTVRFSARFFLSRGDEVTPDFASIEKYGDAVTTTVVEGTILIEHEILLGRRRAIAGIEKALLGMTPGSYREVLIPPHLGYGSKGLGSLIPANALLKTKIWVHDVHAAG